MDDGLLNCLNEYCFELSSCAIDTLSTHSYYPLTISPTPILYHLPYTDHMAKIKDRLIFETKKMESVERRKSNKEQTVMARERHAHRLSEKAKTKKANLKEVDDWKKSAQQGRAGLGGKVRDWQEDEEQLRGMGGGASNKRVAINKRYGFGGKTGRFKQNDPKDKNNMRDFNPRGGFGGVGQKTQGGDGKKKGGGYGGGGGGGNKRPGKRARDSKR